MENIGTTVSIRLMAVMSLITFYVSIIAALRWPLPLTYLQIEPDLFSLFLIAYYTDWVVSLIFYLRTKKLIGKRKTYSTIFSLYLLFSIFSRFFIAGIASGMIVDETYIFGIFLLVIDSGFIFSISYILAGEPLLYRIKLWFKFILLLEIPVLLIFFPIIFLAENVYYADLYTSIIYIGLALAICVFKLSSQFFRSITFFLWAKNLDNQLQVINRDDPWPTVPTSKLTNGKAIA